MDGYGAMFANAFWAVFWIGVAIGVGLCGALYGVWRLAQHVHIAFAWQ